MTHDFLNDLQVGFVLAEASAECVPQDMAAKLWQKNRVTIFFLRLGFFFLIIVCTNRADSAVDGIGEINLSIASAENKAGVPINFIGAETNDLLILVFFQKGIEHFINHWNNADARFRFGRVYMVGASAIFLHTINKIVVDLHEKKICCSDPCVVMTATDGCFGYVESPIHFEILLLDTLLQSYCIEDWQEKLFGILKKISADDYTMCLAGFGYATFDELRATFEKRHEFLMKAYLSKWNKSSEEQQRKMWLEYAEDYLSDQGDVK